jgi:hypothetical protein
MDWPITLAMIAALGGLTTFAGWKSSQPRKDSLRARWISWPVVTVFAGALLLFAIIHAMNLWGFHTGSRTLGKYGA